MEQIEKRREPRFPFQMPLELYKRNQDTPLKAHGTTDNVSMNGFRAHSATEFSRGDRVICNFRLADITADKRRSEGVIKWKSGNGKYLYGVELLGKDRLAPPLMKCFESYFPERSTTYRSDLSAQKTGPPQIELSSEIYRGLVFRLFGKQIFSELIGLSGEIELRNFYVQKLLASPLYNRAEKEINKHLGNTEKTLDKTRQTLNNIITFLHQLTPEPSPEKQGASPGAIPINDLCQERVIEFNKKIESIMPDNAVRVSYHAENSPPPLLGLQKYIQEGLDLLLLYCYQYALFFRAGKVDVRLKKLDNQITIIFFNNGSRIFALDNIELQSDRPGHIACANYREERQFALLNCIHALFRSVKGSLSLSNQSGNNLLTVKIPV